MTIDMAPCTQTLAGSAADVAPTEFRETFAPLHVRRFSSPLPFRY